MARGHPSLLVVLACGALVRLAAEIAYAPALFFSDSWRYLAMTFTGVPVGILPSRPSGYSLILRILTFPGRDVLAVTIAQHLAGLLVAVLVYALLVRLRVSRHLAAAGAAVVALDAYAIALEQFVMAEALFTVLLVGALALTVHRRSSAKSLALAGVLLAVACTVRTTGLFVIPVWVGYLLWRAADRRRLALAIVGLVAPLLLYCSWHAWETGGSFNLEESQGWFLYGRVAQIADCHGVKVPAPTQRLCNPPAWMVQSFHPGIWVWGVYSPAIALFGGTPDHYAGIPGGEPMTVRDNRLLEQFSLAIIRAHPWAYAKIAASDFLRFFDPTVSPGSDADGVTVTFPSAPLTGWVYTGPRDQYLPGYVSRVRWPAPLLNAYGRVLHTPRALLGALALLAVIAMVAPNLLRRRLVVGHRAEIFLLTGSGLAMLAGSAAMVGFVVRYLIPSVPLLMSGGVLAVHELLLATQTGAAPSTARGAPPAVAGVSLPMVAGRAGGDTERNEEVMVNTSQGR